eukprot:CAMPEP_0184694510 /NCGR_PEP_ID=MMETSP0313-20130426/2437_1 /TAXON_ID=2792 /ORGANISM="Porphyridium aerugineum, Strain SAG 1380-2" /LENGTH=389 /DNA_ID=CAMNT_0027152805 /DNA_START=215 /DNA_END=1384 /DNA_ORIENTATION=+
MNSAEVAPRMNYKAASTGGSSSRSPDQSWNIWSDKSLLGSNKPVASTGSLYSFPEVDMSKPNASMGVMNTFHGDEILADEEYLSLFFDRELSFMKEGVEFQFLSTAVMNNKKSAKPVGVSYATALQGPKASPSSSSSLSSSQPFTVDKNGYGAAFGSAAPPSTPSKPLCTFHMTNSCRYGANCKFLHGDPCEYCQQNALHPLDKYASEYHTLRCKEKFELNQLASSLANSNSNASGRKCGICQNNPTEIRRSYGLLQNCNHLFCLECIRDWRSNAASQASGDNVARSCPMCQEVSLILIPSPTFITDPEKKGAMFDKYLKKLSEIPCKHFNYGEGQCPFLGKCYFRHCDKDGNDIDKSSYSKSRYRVGQDGKLEEVKEFTLADFLGTAS